MYRFKLEALLNHRRHQEENCQKELAQANRKLSNEQVTLEQKKRKKQDYLDKLKIKQIGLTTVSDVLLYMDYIEQLSNDIESQSILVNKSAKAVEQKRQDLIAVMKKHKTLKRLKYREMLAYQRKLMHNERKLMDELASIRHAHKM